MTETLSVRIGTAKDLYKSPSEAYIKIKNGIENKAESRPAKKTKDGKWAWNELIQIKKDLYDKNIVVEVWVHQLVGKHMIAYVTIDVTDPKLPQTATWYNLGKPKESTSRGEIEITVESNNPRTPRAKAVNLEELDAQMGMSFGGPEVSPRPSASLDPEQFLPKLEGETMWLNVSEKEIYPLKLSKISCDVMTVKIIYVADAADAKFTVWLPQSGLEWTKEYNQGPYVRGQLEYGPIQPRPCFKIKYTLSEGEGDLGSALITARLISDNTKSAINLKGCFKISKSAVKKAIDEDSHYDAAHVYDERELLDVSFKAIPEKVKACLDRWDDVNVQDDAKETPLHRAVMNGNEEIIKMLIERGADPRITNNFSQTPVDIAEKYFKADLIPLLRTYQ
eukprot:TRINITY_DN1118_c0_g1_i1.p1 TRINITY_DN1118_c0_g1~~TRINITY_DN1118_c0_g1_i1.p1  ORF type:complete len:408 (-),score=151.99 TRINITY_DN1118_c0_g1_i1:166-1344(-)